MPMQDRLDEPLKGLLVQVPVTDCFELSNTSDVAPQALTIIVSDGPGEDGDSFEIRFRVNAIDIWLDTWLFGSLF